MGVIHYCSRFFKRELRPADIISDLYIRAIFRLSYFAGTFFFRIKARLFGVSLNGKVSVWGRVDILRGLKSEITIGKDVSLVSDGKRCSASCLYAPVKLRTFLETAKIIIGDGTGLNGTSITARSKAVNIGRNVMIAPNVIIMDSDFHKMWPPEERTTIESMDEDSDVNIEDNVWIGANCIILKGVRIGENSVIAAGSVVTRDIPGNALAAGTPAKVIKELGK